MEKKIDSKISFPTAVKSAVLLTFLVAANVLFATVCTWSYNQYEILFLPGLELLYLALWIIGSIILVVALAGVLVALVRPFWLIIVSFFLSGIVFIFIFKTDLIISIGLCLGYILLAILSSRSVIKDMDSRIDFSVDAINKKQKALLIVLIIIIAFNFGLGYKDDTTNQQSIVPPFLKQPIIESGFSRIEKEIERQPETSPGGKAAAIEQARQNFEQEFDEMINEMIRPYASFIWLLLVFIIIGILNMLFIFVSWIPYLLMLGIFSLLKALGIIKVVVETKEKKRFILS